MQEVARHVDIDSGLLALGDQGAPQGRCFWMTIVPKDLDRVKQVVVFFHGAGEHIGSHFQNIMLTCVTLFLNSADRCFV